MNINVRADTKLQSLCEVADLVPFSGVAVLHENEQIALFYLPAQSPGHQQCVYAVSNYDPIARANVLSRGIFGDKAGEPVVASPMYKQHFSLLTGQCLEDPGFSIQVFAVRLRGGLVLIDG